MSSQILNMKYHPAKKEVEFRRFQSETEIPIRNDSVLKKYMNKEDGFVLQDHGNAFFEDITKVFDGETIVNVQVITTRKDFEDFMQMLEYFNETSKIHINATLISELPDMDEAYKAVKYHGNEAIRILKMHESTFWNINYKNEDIKKCIDIFSKDVRIEVDSIQEKINSLNLNNINLCFTGVYSAGKSALINSILGYPILPENIKSETARMFSIQSPKNEESVRIIFYIGNSYTEIMWKDIDSVFEFVAGKTECKSRERIQTIINENREKAQYKQINEILKVLNSDDEINPDIRIYFPIPLDNDKLQFKIYDTPGTDSNFGEHQQILKDALSEQTHSILVFVAAPNKTEGEGNNALLNYLKEAEQKDSKTSIDIGRSLFVVNWADSIGPEQRKALQSAEIKDKTDEKFSIKLSDKKLFFTSAKIAYAAKARMNGISTEDEEFEIKKNIYTIDDATHGCYYKQNRFATSELATIKMIERNEDALRKAQEENDEMKKMFICSGVYALESEIKEYGEKYASAVKTFSIIDSVDKALAKMNESAMSLEKQNHEDIKSVNAEISNLKKIMESEINDVYNNHCIPEKNPLPDNTLRRLNLSKEMLDLKLIGEPKTFIEKLLKGWFFGIGTVKYSEKNKNTITQKITTVLNDFTGGFLEERENLLRESYNEFRNDINESIQKNGDISEEAKRYILNVPGPNFKDAKNIESFGEIYDSHKRSKKVLFSNKEYIDKDSLIKDIELKLASIASDITSEYTKDYRDTLKKLLEECKLNYEQNIENYSVLIKGKIQYKKALEQLKDKISNAASDLRSCQKDLNKIIWEEKGDVR